MTWQECLTALVKQPTLHARFLNTLSLLEFIGARKIMKSQEEDSVTPAVLAHATEEIRHAQVLKKLAMKLDASDVVTYQSETLLCGEIAKAYIHGIDYKAQSVLGENDSWRNYLLTTLVVEERAQEIYPFYDDLLTTIGLGGPLKTIVREEVSHLEEVIERLRIVGGVSKAMMDEVREEERRLFDRFFTEVAQALKKPCQKTEAHI